MRRIVFAAVFTFALAVASVAPTLAASPPGPHFQSHINVWGTLDKNSQAEIDGSFVVPDGSSGPHGLWLYGSRDGKTWIFTGQGRILDVVKGQTSYGFSFSGKPDSNGFRFFQVRDADSESRTLDRDECGYRVPEAPATPLLLLGAFPAGALFVLKAAKVRLPRPHLHRIG